MSEQAPSSCYTRRRYLSAAAATTAVTFAGCLGGDNGENGDDGENGENGENEREPGTTVQEDIDLDIRDEEYFVRESFTGNQPAVDVSVVNNGDVMASNIRVEVDFFHADGELLGTALKTLPALPSGDEWLARVFSTTVVPERVEDYSVFLEAEHEDNTVPFEVQDVRIDDGDEPSLVGTGVFEGDTATGVELLGLVYTDGRVVADSREHVRDLEPEEEWEFELTIDWGTLELIESDSEVNIIPVQAGVR